METVNMEELKKSCLGLKGMFICLANHHDFNCKDCTWDDFCHKNATRFTEESEKELDRQRYKVIETILKALEEYEAYRTAEEQGLLLRLPCKVGDEVYIIYDKEVHKAKAIGVLGYQGRTTVRIYTRFDMYDFFYGDGRTMEHETFGDFGEEVFLTREEAEKALEDMKGGEQHE